jgi:hypothetical protein
MTFDPGDRIDADFYFFTGLSRFGLRLTACHN